MAEHIGTISPAHDSPLSAHSQILLTFFLHQSTVLHQPISSPNFAPKWSTLLQLQWVILANLLPT